LPSATSRSESSGRLEGYSNPELAERLGCTLATIGRKLDRIRHVWGRLQNENE
jgi:hypothetical protein